jgi:hypothetical protein
MAKSAIPSHAIKNLSDLLGHVERIKSSEEAAGNKADFIFRGQNTDKPLLPKLGRPPLHIDLQNRERLMLQEFRRLYVGLSDVTPESEWDLIALTQHYGLPTRFLDWTNAALASVWFAVESEGRDQKGKSQKAVVWLLKAAVADFITDEQRKDGGVSPLDDKKTRIYRPVAITPRIAVQGGLFTVHQLRPNHRDFLPLQQNEKYKEKFIKFVIEADDCTKIKKELNGCGVNRASLFPDLGGLCSHLAWRYFGLS